MSEGDLSWEIQAFTGE